MSDLHLQQFESRLVKGAAAMGMALSPDQIVCLVSHARELMLWNKKMNLTAIREPGQIAEKHFLDALAVSRLFTGGPRVMDLGSGGGFPGIPLKVMHPYADLTLVDAVHKKVSFLNHVIRTLGLDQIRAIHTRVEDLAEQENFSRSFDDIIARGFASLDAFASLALPLLKPSGTLWALKGEGGGGEITPSLEQRFDIRSYPYTLPFEKAGRILLCLVQKS